MGQLKLTPARGKRLFAVLLTPITPGAKRAVVILFIFTVALAGANLLFTTREVAANDHKFCQVVTGFTATPVRQPARPKATPAQESQYLWYRRFARLSQDLGC